MASCSCTTHTLEFQAIHAPQSRAFKKKQFAMSKAEAVTEEEIIGTAVPGSPSVGEPKNACMLPSLALQKIKI